MSNSQSIVKQLDKWHKTRQGLAIFAAAELVLGYLFASLAIDSGSFWHYGLALVFLIGGIQNTVQLLGRIMKRQ